MRRRYRNNGPLLAFLIRRLLFAVIVLVALAAIDYGLYRFFRPDFYPGDTFLGGVGHDMERVFLHFDFGRACAYPGCPPVRVIWERLWRGDLYLLAGGLFEPSFGVLPLPFCFHPLDYEEPFSDPAAFVRAMVVPWVVVAAPLAAS